MKKSNTAWKALLGGAIVLGLLLAGCDNGLSPSGGSLDSNSGTGRVTLNVGLAGQSAQSVQNLARTVYPGADALNGVTYTVSFTATGEGTNLLDQELTSGESFDLEPGTYTVAVTGYAEVGGVDTAIAVGSVEGVTVAAGGNTATTVILGPKSDSGDGTFSYDITVPDGLASGKLAITNAANELVGSEVNLTAPGKHADGNVTLAAGTYRLAVTLVRGTDEAEEFAGFSEALHIYAGQKSALPTTEFTADDFSTQVAAVALTFTAPVVGVGPDTTKIIAAQYTGDIAWKVDDNEFNGTEFAGEVAYTAVVTLAAVEGYTFTGIAQNSDSFTHTAAGATVTNEAGNGGTIKVTVAFTATDPAVVDPAKRVLTNLVTAPVVAEAPQKAPFESADEFEVTAIAWKDGIETFEGPLFDGLKAYTAEVTLKAKTGYTFDGIAGEEPGDSTFTHGGAATVANEVANEKEIVVTIVFANTLASTAQTLATTLGSEAFVATGLDEVKVKQNASIGSSGSIPSGIKLVVDSSIMLTVNASETLTVAGTLVVGEGSLVDGGSSIIATDGAGYVDVKDAANLATVLGMAGEALAVTLSDDASLSGTSTLAGGTVLTIADGATLTVPSSVTFTIDGSLDAAGTLATTDDGVLDGTGTVTTSTGSVQTSNPESFGWALANAGTGKITALELTATATLTDSAAIPADVAVTLSANLTVPNAAVLTVDNTVAFAGTGTIIAQGNESSGTIKVGDLEGLTTDETGVTGDVLLTAAGVLATDAAKFDNTAVNLDNDTFGTVTAKGIGSVTLVDNSATEVKSDVDAGGQGTGISVDSGTDFATTPAGTSVAGTNGSGGANELTASAFTLAIDGSDSYTLKLTDASAVGSIQRKGVVTFDNVSISNGGVTLPLGNLSVGVITVRND
ncbi:MAG: hypothetical protein LBK61_06005 [Spirochaetaceae bacterium]|jgi:hypothetical protein|nr:hypothetical protein [Spirochaetaceae bacterium]